MKREKIKPPRNSNRYPEDLKEIIYFFHGMNPEVVDRDEQRMPLESMLTQEGLTIIEPSDWRKRRD